VQEPIQYAPEFKLGVRITRSVSIAAALIDEGTGAPALG
jgi:hypothetical protein